MDPTAARRPRLSAIGVERTLAALLLGLLGLYGVGKVLRGTVPGLDIAGVIAVHLALIVGAVFPLVVLGHAMYGRLRTEATSPRTLEIVTATVALSSFCVAMWLALDPASTLDTPLFAIAACALFVLVGLVADSP